MPLNTAEKQPFGSLALPPPPRLSPPGSQYFPEGDEPLSAHQGFLRLMIHLLKTAVIDLSSQKTGSKVNRLEQKEKKP